MNDFTEAAAREDLSPSSDRSFKQLIQATDDCIAHHPWGAVGFALAFGLLCGALMGGRSSSEETCCRYRSDQE